MSVCVSQCVCVCVSVSVCVFEGRRSTIDSLYNCGTNGVEEPGRGTANALVRESVCVSVC